MTREIESEEAERERVNCVWELWGRGRGRERGLVNRDVHSLGRP
jgi:hypothetical protein